MISLFEKTKEARTLCKMSLCFIEERGGNASIGHQGKNFISFLKPSISLKVIEDRNKNGLYCCSFYCAFSSSRTNILWKKKTNLFTFFTLKN